MLLEANIEIKGIIKSTFLDWDGMVVTTVYLPRCNLRCPFCHNWELIEHPEKFETIPISELNRHLMENRDFLDGVCITGGEPTIYSNLPEFVEHIKDLDFKVKIDTNGTNPKLLSNLINQNNVDYIAMDFKAPLNNKYHKLVGIEIDLNKLKESVKIIMDSGIDYEFRTTFVPTLLDEQDFIQISENILGAKKYVLQQFVPDHTRAEWLKDLKPYSIEVFEKLKGIIEKNFDKVTLRGIR